MGAGLASDAQMVANQIGCVVVVALQDQTSMSALRLTLDDMRAADVDEIKASSGLSPLMALKVSARASRSPVAALVDGEPVAVFGIVNANTIENIGAPWLLGTDRLDEITREWLKDAPQWIMLLSDGYSLLRNWVDARNVRSIRWLKHMGFKVKKSEPFGLAGLPFRQFERRV